MVTPEDDKAIRALRAARSWEEAKEAIWKYPRGIPGTGAHIVWLAWQAEREAQRIKPLDEVLTEDER